MVLNSIPTLLLRFSNPSNLYRYLTDGHEHRVWFYIVYLPCCCVPQTRQTYMELWRSRAQDMDFYYSYLILLRRFWNPSNYVLCCSTGRYLSDGYEHRVWFYIVYQPCCCVPQTRQTCMKLGEIDWNLLTVTSTGCGCCVPQTRQTCMKLGEIDWNLLTVTSTGYGFK